MARYGRIPEDEKALRVMDLEEERRLVNAVLAKNHVIGCYVGVLGETALRMTEGLLLKWKFVNLGERNLTVEASKNYKTRHVPLSDYAIELLRSLPRVIGCEYVFALALTKDRWRDPRGPFYAGRKAVGLEWVGFHDFRHFRASQWVMRGIDLRDRSGIVGTPGYNDDDEVRALRTESCDAEYPGRSSSRDGRTIQETSRHRRQIGDKTNGFR
jgi:integrase